MNAVNLRDFTAAVKAVIRTIPAELQVGGKVWVHLAWEWCGMSEVGHLSLAEFKGLVALANQARLLDASRCDLVQAFDAYDVRRAEMTFMEATYHFLRVD